VAVRSGYRIGTRTTTVVTSAEVVNVSTSIGSHCYSKAGVAVQSIVEVCGKSAITGGVVSVIINFAVLYVML
jgi:hypothetical protein